MMHVKGLEEAVVSATALVENFQNPSLGVALGLAKMPVTQALTALTGAAGQLAAAMSNYTPVRTPGSASPITSPILTTPY